MVGNVKMCFNAANRSITAFIKEKKALIAVCLFIYLLISFLFVYQGITLYNNIGLHTCVADCYVFASMIGRRVLAGIPVFLILTLMQVRNNRRTQQVLRLKKRCNIWMQQCISIIYIAIGITCMEMVSIGLFGKLLTTPLLVWSEKESVFWYAIGQTDLSTAFWQVVLGFGITTFLTYLFTGILFSFVEWFTGSFSAGICSCIAFAFAEDASGLYLIYNRVSILYEQWKMGNLWNNCLWAFLIIAGFTVVGVSVADRKEFYGV